MRQYLRWSVAAIAMATMVGLGAAATLAQDKEATVKARQETMKQEGPALRTIQDYINDKGTDQATAIAKAQDLIALVDKLITLWPAGTSSKDFPGKSNAKPEVWEQLDKFKGLYTSMKSDEQKLLAVLQKGDKTAAAAAVSDIGKNGCGGCHGLYREKTS